MCSDARLNSNNLDLLISIRSMRSPTIVPAKAKQQTNAGTPSLAFPASVIQNSYDWLIDSRRCHTNCIPTFVHRINEAKNSN